MEFKKGDIIAAEFEVMVGGEPEDFLAVQTAPWKLVRRALDLSKPLRFIKNPNNKILGAMESVDDPNLVVVEIRSDTGFVMVHRIKVSDLENIPEDEL